MEKHYSLVKFLEEDGDDLIEIVPTKWLIGTDKAYWPPKKGSRDKITRWVMSLIDPETDWEQFPIVLKHQYSTYNNARKGLVKAEEETNIDSNVSDCDGPRKKKIPVRFELDDSDNHVPPKRHKTIVVASSDSEDDLDQENASVRSALRDKVQSLLKNVSSRKRKPFSEQSLNRVVEGQNKNDSTILKKNNLGSKRTKHIVVQNTADSNVSRKYHYQHQTENEKSNLFQEKNTTLSCQAAKHRGAKNAYKHDGLVDSSVVGRGDIKDIREDISVKSADVGGDNNEKSALTRRASIFPLHEFTSPPGPSNRPDENFDIQKSHSFTMDDASPVNTPCIKTKDKAMSQQEESNSIPLLDLDTLDILELDTTNISPINLNTDENNQSKSPSLLFIPRKRVKRFAFYPVKKNAPVIITENSATTLVNNTSKISDEDEVIEASPMQRSVASKVKQCLKLKRKIPVKRLDFSLCPSPKHISTQMENVNTLKDKVNISYLSPIKMHNKTDIQIKKSIKTQNKDHLLTNKMDFNLDDTENKPPEKKIWQKKKRRFRAA